MKKLITVFTVITVAIIPVKSYAEYGNGHENDSGAPAAFVEGTRDYTIKYFDRMSGVFAKNIKNNSLSLETYTKWLARLKSENADLEARINYLKTKGEFLRANDPAYTVYLKNLAALTDLMFYLMRDINSKKSAE